METMRMRKRFARSVAGIAVATAPAAMLAFGGATAGAAPPNPPTAIGPTKVPLGGALRRCDFSDDTHLPGAGTGSAFALISTTGSKLIAEVHLTIAAPDTHYNVRLIELPQPANRCSVGDAGTAVGALDTDAGGNANVTIQEDVLPGATGAWVFIEGPPGISKQLSGDFYTSDFVVPI
jgi:hypothetical protein